MRMQTNLVRRGTVYYFRRRVSAYLLQYYPNPVIRESLRTPDKATAIECVRGRVAELDAEFARHRATIGAPARTLTSDLANSIARALVAHMLTADDEQRIEGMDEATFDARSSALQAGPCCDPAGLCKG